MKALLALAGAGVIGVGVGTYVFTRPTELPPPQVGVHAEVFPDLDFRAAAPGSAVERIYGTFGKKPPELGDRPTSRRCIYFMYDPDLFGGALVVLADAALVKERWVVKGSERPAECSDLPEERVDLRGWYAAAAR
jgi:hypothetical protein